MKPAPINSYFKFLSETFFKENIQQCSNRKGTRNIKFLFIHIERNEERNEKVTVNQ